MMTRTVNKVRLIDVDELIEQLTPPEDAQNNGAKLLLAVFVDAVKAFPTIDAVPVIRCRECVHRYVDGDNVRFNVCELNHNKVQSDDWFCADGDRKDLSLPTDNSEPRVELEPISGERKVYHGELDVRNGKLTIYGSDRCVCCGAVVPEGRMVCPSCERRANE